MELKTLRVRAKGDTLVQNHERLAMGINEFVGRKYAEREGRPGEFGFLPTSDVVELPSRAEYLKALLDGDLLPADEATAKAAGVELVVERPRTVLPAARNAKDGDS